LKKTSFKKGSNAQEEKKKLPGGNKPVRGGKTKETPQGRDLNPGRKKRQGGV